MRRLRTRGKDEKAGASYGLRKGGKALSGGQRGRWKRKEARLEGDGGCKETKVIRARRAKGLEKRAGENRQGGPGEIPPT